MKWHLVDEDSLEEKMIEIGYGEHGKEVSRTFGALMCGGKKHEWKVYNKYSDTYYDIRMPLVLKDTVNLNGNGVCTYCRNFRLEQLGLKDNKVMG